MNPGLRRWSNPLGGALVATAAALVLGHFIQETREREGQWLDRTPRITGWTHGAGQFALHGLGVLSGIGAGAIYTALLAGLVGLLVLRRQWSDAAFVVLAIEGARVVDRLLKSGLHRTRPHHVISGYFLPKSVTLGLIAIAAVAVVALVRRDRLRVAIVLAVSGTLLAFADQAISMSVRVPHGHDAFPSGHATSSAALATAVVLLLWNSRHRVPALVGAGLYILAVGSSRVLLGYHHVTDVLAGWALAVFVVVTARMIQAAVTGAVQRRRTPAIDGPATPQPA